MSRKCKGLVLVLAVLTGSVGLRSAGSASESVPPPSNPSELRERLEAHVGAARFRHALWGVQIVSLDSGRVVFSHNADKLMIPASNTKLYTGALALDRLGPDFRIRTSLYTAARPSARGTLAGDLLVYGRGDPSLAARYHGGDLDRALEPLVGAVRAAGVRRIRGDLVTDDSFFPDPPLGSGWSWDDLQFYYGAEVSALTVNDNAVDVVVEPAPVPGRLATVSLQPPTSFLVLSNLCMTGPPGSRPAVDLVRPLSRNVLIVTGQLPVGATGHTDSVTVHQPGLWFGHLLRDSLRRHGIRVDGRVRAAGEEAGQRRASGRSGPLRELGAVASPPLSELLGRMLKPSQNLHAQLLLLQVGAAERSRPPEGVGPGSALPAAEPAGLEAMDAFLRRLGAEPDTVLLEEGSGLSRRNLVTPEATVRLLQYMDRHPHAAVFRTALPVAGVDGTLRMRMRETPAEGNAQAKTGTLRYVVALSGYVTSAAGEPFAYSLMLNQYRSGDPARSARAELDAIVVLLAGFAGRSDT